MDVVESGVVCVSTNELSRAPAEKPDIPWYMEEIYWWAYMRPASITIFDHLPVVSLILFGNYNRLKRTAAAEITPGQSVLQPACVYGDVSSVLAEKVGASGALDVIDVVPLQAENSARKLQKYPWCRVRLANAVAPGGGPYDAVNCFFLLHELPDNYKRIVTDALLASVRPGGKVIFIDYHRPRWWHPLWPLQATVFRFLEPFAKSLWRCEIPDLASDSGDYNWRKETFFGGFFQKVVAVRKATGR